MKKIEKDKSIEFTSIKFNNNKKINSMSSLDLYLKQHSDDANNALNSMGGNTKPLSSY